MSNTTNKTMMQYFEWYLTKEDRLWNQLKNRAEELARIGIDMVWLPPAYKGADGDKDAGYAVYDLYDLGEFDQKGSVSTKYGSKDEYLNAIKALHENHIEAYADIVLNQRLGADSTEEVLAVQDDNNDRNKEVSNTPIPIQAWTKYDFPGRNNQYSSFKWNWTHFHGVDWDEATDTTSIYKFYGKHWDNEVDKERGNFDYLMGADVDLNNVDVVTELTNWGKWYVNFTDVDGFRIDAVKHIRYTFFEDWLKDLREDSKKDLFSFGEYWNTNVQILKDYLIQTGGIMSLFDVPLHYNLYQASNSNGNYDMRTILDGTLVKEMPDKAVTFVDNHDTEPGQSLFSWIQGWFKPLAYSLILLRKDGLPCIFYGDYYGIPNQNIAPIDSILKILLKARKYLAYGKQNDYFDDPNIIGWTREGDLEHPNSGLAVIMTDNAGGAKQMNVGLNLAGCTLYDCTGNIKEPVYIDYEGNGIFYVNGGSVSVWVKKGNMFAI